MKTIKSRNLFETSLRKYYCDILLSISFNGKYCPTRRTGPWRILEHKCVTLKLKY